MSRWVYRIGCALVALLALGGGVAQAQFADAPAPSPREVPAGQAINVFAEWIGETPIDGFYAALPGDWHLEEAVALQSAGTRRVPLTVRPTDEKDATHFIGAEETLRGPVELILRVHTGAARGTQAWALTPFTYRAEQRLRRLRAHRLERQVNGAEATTTPVDNQVLSFQNAGAPLLLDAARLPSLSTRAPFTVETWFKTTGLGEVLLSTWDGTEKRPYPVELIVDPGGRLRYYRGRPERHESMTTPAPVADGAWHHVAVTHDPTAGRTRLLLDGQAVDSLRGTVPLESGLSVVALGGRVPSPRPSDGQEATPALTDRFSGALDEVYFWPQVRSEEAVRGTMRQPRRPAASSARGEAALGTGEGGPALLHFQGKDWPPTVATRVPPGVRRTQSGLRFMAPITDLRARTAATGASPAEAVSVAWTAPARGTFLIERAADGGDFQPVGRRKSQAGRQRYTFADVDARGEVVRYRIRQQFADGSTRVSGTLKVGRGATKDAKQGVTLMGNFPNPFTEETTIAYQVHEETHVRLSVWDLTGQRVTTLLDKTQGTGHKEVVFRPENLSSGTYFIRLHANGQTHTRKMALVK